MHDTTQSLTITFNGEIYNFRELRQEISMSGYQFRSHSDTEVVLAAYERWGVDCLHRLNGMFAFALYDARRRALFLARDRAGEKPLFYSLVNEELRFASEVKALIADRSFPRRVSLQALDAYLTFGYVPGDLCMVDGIAKLPPAHALWFELERPLPRIWRYWRLPPAPDARSLVNPDLLAEELEGLLEDAVRLQMQADVPACVLLSGGVDSSLIATMAARTSSRTKTFTVGFPDYAAYDERLHAQRVAQHLGTEHIELDGGQATPEVLDILARQYDEPLADSSMIPTYLISRAVKQYCTVALGGDGGDELFGGYPHYDRLLWLQRNSRRVPSAIRRLVASGARAVLPIGFKGRNWLRALGVDLDRDLPLIGLFFDTVERRQLARDAFPIARQGSASDVWPRRDGDAPVDDLLQRATRIDFDNYLAGDILVKVDRASMISSLELRAPFLDFRIVEFAFGKVPSAWKANLQQRKIVPKRLVRKLLPPEFDQRRKQGFSIPLAAWLRNGGWRDRFCSVLYDSSCLFDRRMVQHLIRGLDRGRNNQERLFALTMFELWRKEYRVAI